MTAFEEALLRQVNRIGTNINGQLHEGGEVIAGNTDRRGATDGTGWAQQLRAAQQTHKALKGPIWQCSLRLAPDDPILDNGQWAVMATQFVERMGLGEHPWVAVRHGADRIRERKQQLPNIPPTPPDLATATGRALPRRWTSHQGESLHDQPSRSSRAAPHACHGTHCLQREACRTNPRRSLHQKPQSQQKPLLP